MAVHRNCLDLFHYDGGAADRLSNFWSLRGPHWQTLSAGDDYRRRGRDVTSGRTFPTYAQVGVCAYVIFCTLRLCMGIFFGDEYAVGHTFAIGYAPKKKRRAIGRFIQPGFPLGYVSASLVFAVSSLTSREAMWAYGWRIALRPA